MLGPILEKKAIWRAALPPETMEEWKKEMDIGRERWGRFFSNQDQCDLFNMLPISDEDRSNLMTNMIKASQLRDEVRSCTGGHASSHEHRDQCIKCVTLHHPEIAKPFY